MGYADEIKSYIDSDDLIGSTPNPTPVSTGNPLTLCGVSACIDSDKDSEANQILTVGVSYLQSPVFRGIWDKKARSNDQVTHDDLIGLTAFSFLLKKPFHIDLCQFGIKNNWVLSNTGKKYWTAIAKPWHRAYYKLCSGIEPSIIESLCLAAMLNFSISFSENSGLQLSWLMIKCLEKLNRFESACKRFRKKISMKKVLSEYHGENHPFSKYCNE